MLFGFSYVGIFLVPAAVTWSTATSSGMLVSILQLAEMRWLIAYPLALLYTAFVLITVF